MDMTPWMLVGFLLAAYAVMANDSLQTLGTYIASNASRTPKGLQMGFLSAITISVMTVSWWINSGDPSWGRLEQIPLPAPFTWVYVVPPLAVLALTAWGAPVSTSFLVLCSIAPSSISPLLSSSLSGYVMAFSVGLTAWWAGLWLQERWAREHWQTVQEEQAISPLWIVLQWLSTGLLWGTWMVQDLANIFVYLPRQLSGTELAFSSLLLCGGLCVLVARGGGPIQAVLRSKTNTTDLRSATLIDILFGFCLLARALLSSFPLSTTWVFLGLLGGRELALQLHTKGLVALSTEPHAGELRRILCGDIWKACAGLVVSLTVALGMQPLVQWAAS